MGGWLRSASRRSDPGAEEPFQPLDGVIKCEVAYEHHGIISHNSDNKSKEKRCVQFLLLRLVSIWLLLISPFLRLQPEGCSS